MTMQAGFEIQEPPTWQFGAGFVAIGQAIAGAPGYEIGADSGLEFASSFVSRGRIITAPAREIFGDSEFGAVFLAELNPRTHIFQRGAEVSVFAQPYHAGDNTIELLIDVNLRLYAALRSAILPDSTGKISHLRMLAVPRVEAQARRMFDIMKGQI